MTYSQVKDYIVQFVQKTFENGDDIEVSLRKEELLDISGDEPVRSISQEDDADERKFEQDGFDIKYKAELDEYMERKKTLKKIMSKTYALIMQNHCHKKQD